jgi:uncharacterized protein with GYD domain
MFQGRYTADAIKAMIKTPQDREKAAKALLKSVGGKLHSIYFCFGSEDIVALIEAPDDKTAAASSFAIGASGAFSAGATTKLMTTKEAMEGMKMAQKAAASYKPPTG